MYPKYAGNCSKMCKKIKKYAVLNIGDFTANLTVRKDVPDRE